MKNRVKQLISELGISQREFETSIGAANGYVNSISKSIGSSKLNKLLEVYPSVNLEWLMTGKGAMFNTADNQNISEPVTAYSNRFQIPYFNLDANTSNIEMFFDQAREADSHLSVPGFDDCDFALNVFGDSMNPRYLPGDIVICKQINDKSVILYGQAYLIVTEDLRVIKIARPGTNNRLLTLESCNDDYNNFEIERDKIRNLFLVKGKLRREVI